MEDELPTYFLVCLHRRCCNKAAAFVANALSADLEKGGAELVVRQEEMPADKSGLVIHVSATRGRLFEIAETTGLKKPDLANGVIREFKAEEAEMFGETGIVGPLTISDVQKCVVHAMDSVHFDVSHKTLPGHESVSVMKKSPVLDAYRVAGLIDTFPLHEEENLAKVYAEWKRSPLLYPPVDSVRDYFGENIALYVSFTSYYTKALIPTAALGVLQFVADKALGHSYYNTILFALLNLVFVTLFLEGWKRRSNEHAYKWGTYGKLRHKRPRPEFRGDYGLNPVTGREEVQYPIGNTVKKMVVVSIPTIFACVAAAFLLMLLSFEADAFVAANLLADEETGRMSTSLPAQALSYVPSVVYSLLVFVMNIYYLHLAHHLSEWENHRTQEQFEGAVVSKLVLFEFVNSFLALFYIAFYLGDVAMLKSQVFMMLLVQQVVNQVHETALPILFRKPSMKRIMNKISKRIDDGGASKQGKMEAAQHGEVSALRKVPCGGSHVGQALFSLLREPYESTYDDFVELWLQFGGVFLFSCVYPLAAVLALANNLLELRMDSYKLCQFSRKPTPRGVRDIGVWYLAFSLTSVVSVMTNCALLAMDVDLRQAFDFGLSDAKWFMLFVGLEHVFFAIRIAIAHIIPDVPSRVKLAFDKDDFILKNRMK